MNFDTNVNELIQFVESNCNRLSAHFGENDSVYIGNIKRTLQNLIAENAYRAEVINTRDGTIKQLQKRVRKLEKELDKCHQN